MSNPVNHAAVIPHERAHPMRVEQLPYPTAGPGELVIHVGAVAINPVDWMIQTLGNDLFKFQYPYVNGCDVAGTIIEVGSNVPAAFTIGDRVLALCCGVSAREGAFQEYVVVHANLATKIPNSLSFTDAAVLPLGVATAASALYEPGALELPLPTLDSAPKAQDQVVLVWAGSSSVGANAVQLATASGYEVFTTCSPHNFDFCRSLGASQVFDYKSPTAVTDIISALQDKTLAGAVAIFPASLSVVYDVLGSNKVQGTKRVGAPMPLDNTPPPPENVTAKGVFAGSIKDDHVGAAIFNDFLTKALAKELYKAQPLALIVGKGLEALQAAVDQCKEGKTSVRKLVVTFEQGSL